MLLMKIVMMLMIKMMMLIMDVGDATSTTFLDVDVIKVGLENPVDLKLEVILYLYIRNCYEKQFEKRKIQL